MEYNIRSYWKHQFLFQCTPRSSSHMDHTAMPPIPGPTMEARNTAFPTTSIEDRTARTNEPGTLTRKRGLASPQQWRQSLFITLRKSASLFNMPRRSESFFNTLRNLQTQAVGFFVWRPQYKWNQIEPCELKQSVGKVCFLFSVISSNIKPTWAHKKNTWILLWRENGPG